MSYDVVSIDGITCDNMVVRNKLYETFHRLNMADPPQYFIIDGVKYMTASNTVSVDVSVQLTGTSIDFVIMDDFTIGSDEEE